MGIEHKSSSKCPAIIFAAKRIAKVNGRITALMSSIKTITGTKRTGVPRGTRCAKNEDLFFKKKVVMYPTHILNLMQLVKTICLVPVKTKGKSPKKLFIKTKTKSPMMNKFREVGMSSPRVTLISLFNDSHKLFTL